MDERNKNEMSRREFIGLSATAGLGLSVIGGDAVLAAPPAFPQCMREVAAANKVIVARDGIPDQFRRDRFVRLGRNGTFAAGDSGSIVIVDYTTGDEGKLPPFVRAYLTTEKELVG
jgi:hypothetical protein